MVNRIEHRANSMMDVLLDKFSYFWNILQTSTTGKVAKWDSSNLSNAIQWSEYIQEVCYYTLTWLKYLSVKIMYMFRPIYGIDMNRLNSYVSGNINLFIFIPFFHTPDL